MRIKLGTGSESATGLAQCVTSSPAREQSEETTPSTPTKDRTISDTSVLGEAQL